MANKHFLTATGIAAALALMAGCSVHKQDAPSLSGPSGLGTNITISVSPDVLTRDGASQSLVTVTATGPTGAPLSNVPIKLSVLNDSGQITDALGTLSAQNVVTNSAGQATAVFTAPSAIPGLGVTTDIEIGALPSGTDFGNETMRVAQLRLVPQGTITATVSLLKPDFAAPSPTVGDSAVFSATIVDSKGNDARAEVTNVTWDFGDGSTASGLSVTHTFTSPGTFPVTLSITDANGGVAFVTHSVTVAQGALPTATFVFSPADPSKNQVIHFNASGSTAAPGHTISDFAWNFGDGTLGSGALIDHTFTQSGTFTVTLKVTDDSGRKSTLFSVPINIGSGNPQADFSFNPSSPHVGQSVTFDGSISQPAQGRSIVQYQWTFDDGSATVTTTSPTVTHTYSSAGTFNVRLVVVDDQGNVSVPAATHQVIVTP